MLVLSTITATPWSSKTWSSSFLLSSASAYWKPEQPPPRTATLRACSWSGCEARSSLILPAAVSVRPIACSGVWVSVIASQRIAVGLVAGSVLPVQVLPDSLRVVDHLVAVDQHGHAALPGQL